MQQVENELDQVQEQLSVANNKLDEKEKALQNVSKAAGRRRRRRCSTPTLVHIIFLLFFHYVVHLP